MWAADLGIDDFETLFGFRMFDSGFMAYRGTSLIRNAHLPRTSIGP